uniref:CRAL-TRIO domain-containing protein n=1 Tax=Guillardia theta TaxID=55529 RepID=A0A7S4N1C8_GUITH
MEINPAQADEQVEILSEAVCSWCHRYSMHLFQERRLLRKNSFRCFSCGKTCCPCDNVEQCGGYAKCLPYWDDALCVRCGLNQPTIQNQFLDHIFRGMREKHHSIDGSSKEELKNSKARDDIVDAIVQNTSTAMDAIRQSSEQLSGHLVNIFKNEPEFDLTSLPEEGSPTRPVEASNGSLLTASLSESKCSSSMHLSHEQYESAAPQTWETVRDNLLGMDMLPHRLHVRASEEMIRRKAFVLRWLRSSKPPMDVQQTTERLLKHLRWRYDEGINDIQNEDWEDFDADRDLYVSGLDRCNRPSCTWHIAKAKGRKPERVARYLICMIERARAVNPDADGINFLFDCTGTSLSTFENLCFLEFVGTLQQNYPENLIRCFVFPVNWVTKQLFEFGKPLLSEETKSKLIFLRNHEIEKELPRFFEVNEIETRYGGTLQIETDALMNRRVSPVEVPPTAGGVQKAPALTVCTNRIEEPYQSMYEHPEGKAAESTRRFDSFLSTSMSANSLGRWSGIRRAKIESILLSTLGAGTWSIRILCCLKTAWRVLHRMARRLLLAEKKDL